ASNTHPEARMHTTTLKALADRFDLRLRGDPDHRVSSLATLAHAGPENVRFLANPAYTAQLADCRAGAVIIAEPLAGRWLGNALISDHVYASWARVGSFLHPQKAARAGIDAMAAVDPGAQVDATASIGPHASIAAGARIERDAVIGPGCVVGEGAVVGESTRLVARVYLGPDCRLGRRVLVHPGAVIGADGFGLAMEAGEWIKVPQLGAVVVGDDCEIGANTT